METVATSIVNTVSFYNTTGVIEREHNLYFTPQSKVVGSLYVNQLKNVVTRNSNYEDIVISQWSPEDRTLTIKGRIEDFRLKYSDNSRPMNYAIMKNEKHYSNNTVVTHYIGYFVVGARQTGNGNVTLELEPDHFSNVFFLGSGLTGYNLFNTYIKNAYVERQHYDRTSYNITVNKSIFRKRYWKVSDEIGNVSLEIHLPKYLLAGNTTFFVHIRDVSINGVSQTIPTPYETVTDEGTYYKIVEEFYSGITAEVSVSVDIEITSNYSSSRFTNDTLFSNYEETFRYRRQFRNKKERVIYPLTDEEKTTLASNPYWSNLSATIKEKILKHSIAVVHYTLKNNKLILPYNTAGGINRLTYPNATVSKQMPDVFGIYAVIPDEYKQYEEEIKEVLSNVYYKENNGTEYYRTNAPIHQLTEKDSLPDYIASCFISKDDELLNHITFEERTVGITNTLCTIVNDVTFMNNKSVSGLTVAPIKLENVTEGGYYYKLGVFQSVWYVQVYKNNAIVDSQFLDLFLMTSSNQQKVTLNLTDNHTLSKTEYFEPILTFSPYSFYTLSYLGNIEVPLNKNSYYQEPVVDIDYVISVTDSMKITLIPTYKVNGNYYKYYTESLTLTLNNEVIFASEVLDQYLIQNKAQMKNQYAINDTNLGKNLATSSLGGLATGFSTGMMTGNPLIGLGAGLIGAGVGAITSVVTWSVQDKEIAMNQKAKIADVGSMPNNLKQTGTDIATDTAINEMGVYLNHYTIDEISYNNIAKYLERYGYLVNMYAELNVYNRKGWNYIKLIDFELDKQMSAEQEESIRQIFKNGVTLVHEPSYLHSNTLHNYEVVLDS